MLLFVYITTNVKPYVQLRNIYIYKRCFGDRLYTFVCYFRFENSNLRPYHVPPRCVILYYYTDAAFRGRNGLYSPAPTQSRNSVGVVTILFHFILEVFGERLDVVKLYLILSAHFRKSLQKINIQFLIRIFSIHSNTETHLMFYCDRITVIRFL